VTASHTSLLLAGLLCQFVGQSHTACLQRQCRHCWCEVPVFLSLCPWLTVFVACSQHPTQHTTAGPLSLVIPLLPQASSYLPSTNFGQPCSLLLLCMYVCTSSASQLIAHDICPDQCSIASCCLLPGGDGLIINAPSMQWKSLPPLDTRQDEDCTVLDADVQCCDSSTVAPQYGGMHTIDSNQSLWLATNV
jgi:hypothetical protein